MKRLRYDRGYSRRKFLADASKGVLSTGVLMPLADAIAATGEINKAFISSLRAETKASPVLPSRVVRID